MDSLFAPHDETFARLARSRFRSRFALSARDWSYARQLGPERLAVHAAGFISERLAAAVPENDGSQTPVRGHPVFVAQHACACCCRGCLSKWYGIPEGVPLTPGQQQAIASLLCEWIARQLAREPRVRRSAAQPDLFG